MINMHRDVLVPPDSHATTALTTVWGMGGRCLDLPRVYQDMALADIKNMAEWPDALKRAWRQLNPALAEDGQV